MADREIIIPAYEKLGETPKIQLENKKIDRDFERLKEKLVFERETTKYDFFDTTQFEKIFEDLKIIAANIRYLANSEIDIEALAYELYEEFYNLIDLYDFDDYPWFSNFRYIASSVLLKVKTTNEEKNYCKKVLADIGNIRKENPTIVNNKWEIWSNKYPEIFPNTLLEHNRPQKIRYIYSALCNISDIVDDYKRDEKERWLAIEIYDQFWNMIPANDYFNKNDILHREMIEEFRENYNEEFQATNIIDVNKIIYLIAQTALQQESEAIKIKKLSDERLAEYQEKATRKTKIQSIGASSIQIQMVISRFSDRIPYTIKDDMNNLVQAVDFSSKIFLDTSNEIKISNSNDISLSKSLLDIKKYLEDDNLIKFLVERVTYISSTFGDNETVFEKLEFSELEIFKSILVTLKKNIENTYNNVPKKQTIKITDETQDTKTSVKNKNNYIFCGAIAFLLSGFYLIATLDMEYWYYQFIRIISFIIIPIFLYVFWKIDKIDDSLDRIVYGLSFIVWIFFNPILPLYMDKGYWVMLDIISAIIFLIINIYLFFVYRYNKS